MKRFEWYFFPLPHSSRPQPRLRWRSSSAGCPRSTLQRTSRSQIPCSSSSRTGRMLSQIAGAGWRSTASSCTKISKLTHHSSETLRVYRTVMCQSAGACWECSTPMSGVDLYTEKKAAKWEGQKETRSECARLWPQRVTPCCSCLCRWSKNSNNG